MDTGTLASIAWVQETKQFDTVQVQNNVALITKQVLNLQKRSLRPPQYQINHSFYNTFKLYLYIVKLESCGLIIQMNSHSTDTFLLVGLLRSLKPRILVSKHIEERHTHIQTVSKLKIKTSSDSSERHLRYPKF